MTGSELNELLKRYQRNEASEQERELVEKWLEPDERVMENIPYSDERMEAVLHRVMQTIHRKDNQRVLGTWLKAAAAIMLLAVASFLLWQWQAVKILNVHSDTVMEKVILPDGSLVWLKENSTLSYPSKFKGETRAVSFRGEALFEVAKDVARPFIIDCNGVTATVLGTSFSIRTGSENTEVTVLTGKVSVKATHSDREVVVLPREKAVYTVAQKEFEKIEAKQEEVRQVTEGTEYDMMFKDTPMSEIIKKLESKFDVRITLEDHTVGNCHITADVTDQSLKYSLDVITEILGLAYKMNGNRIAVSGEGCK